MFRSRPHTARKGERGAFLLEVSFAATFVAIVLTAYTAQLSVAPLIRKQNQEKSIAVNAARQKLEEIRDYGTFAQCFAAYNSLTADDPADAVGAGFAVEGLFPQEGDGDGFPGRVRFPEHPATPGELREDLPDSTLGTPMDLNGNGVATDTFDMASSYNILPVAVVVEWRSATGRNMQVELRTILVNR